MPVDRPERPTLAELREVVQPPHIRNRKVAEHWTGTLYMRRISIYLTRALITTPISANGVTGLMILAGFLAGPALLIPGIWGVVLAALLAQLQMYLDASDGEVARWRGTSGPRGIFLDTVGHYVAEGSIGLFLGLRAAGIIGGQESDAVTRLSFVLLGALLMAGIWLNKSLGMMVPVARVSAKVEQLADGDGSASVPTTTLVGRLRRLARFLPFHVMFHSIEMTLLFLAVSLIALPFGSPLIVDRGLAVVMTVAIYAVCCGHFLAIWASRRLDP